MNKKVIGIITSGESDILEIVNNSSVETIIMKPEEIGDHDLDSMYAIAILGGVSEKPLLFRPRQRVIIERILKTGKKIFSEYCPSIGCIYSAPPESTRFERLAFCMDEGAGTALKLGDILDDQCNTRIKPYDIACSKSRPILQYMKVKEHSRATVDEKMLGPVSDRALWFDNPENLLVCCFRLSNFRKARFSPADKWKSLVKYILEWLCEEEINVDILKAPYELKPFNEALSMDQQVQACIVKSTSWFINSGMLVNGGKDGVKEGLATEVYADGKQRVLEYIRADCTAETSMAFFMNYLLTKDEKSKIISRDLIAVCFDFMQKKEEGPLKGMLRWTQEAWEVCYQDDAARVLISYLLKSLYTGDKEYLGECIDALEFLVNTTGTDGTRIARTENIDLTEERIKQLATTPHNFICAHYNAFYLGSLLLAYKITGIDKFREFGVKGLETLMSHYPDTRREYSETQEICRLIMPLSWLYWVTGDKKHKEWLYSVTADLIRFKHPSGGYLEWDSGYKSDRNNAGDGEESTLLAKNGDPVVDLLYSLNWLPMGFAQAYFVTKDTYFKELWEGIARFFVSTQISSDDRMINGAWARALDVEMMEVYGLNADVGWGPWAIETGWTVSVITSGLAQGLLADELTKHY